MKFQLSSATGLRRIVPERNFSRRDVAVASRAAVFSPSSLWLEKRRPGGHRYWRRLYPILDQWVTSFSHANLKIKFQVSPAPAGLPYSRTKLGTRRLCCCPALSSELGFMLLTSQVVRGSVDWRACLLLAWSPAPRDVRRSDVQTILSSFRLVSLLKHRHFIDLDLHCLCQLAPRDAGSTHQELVSR